MKARLWMLHRVCRSFNLSCSSKDVLLVVRGRDERIHLAASHWTFSNLFALLVVWGSQMIDKHIPYARSYQGYIGRCLNYT